jgi:polysaccharide deacetylase 2 family uncharacterized protein YibQ
VSPGAARRSASPFSRRAWLGACAALALLGTTGLEAKGVLPPPPVAVPGGTPEIAIIIDDLGGRFDAGRRVIGLDGPVACAFLPLAPHTPKLAELAHRHDKEVMLHQPMETMERHALDAGGLTLEMSEQALAGTLQANLARVPHVSGVNNHMGSLLTRHPGHMLWLMRAIRRDERLFFVDSRTTKHTVARQLAYENSVPSVSRDVFLDDTPTPEAVQREFQRLLGLARRNGIALGIGHPHPATLDLLQRELAQLSQHGVKLVPVARLVQRQQERDSLWRASLSP